METNLNVKKFKKNNRDGLFDKLKTWGFAFHKLTYKKERALKINKLLNDGLLGWTHSPELKEGVVLSLGLFANKIQLKVKEEIIKEIFNWEEDITSTFIQISNVYDRYFYTKEEVLEVYKNRPDIKNIEKVLDSIYPTLKVRKINNDKTFFSIYIGAGIVTYLVEKKKYENKKINLYSYFLTKNKNMYSGNIWGLPKKYRKKNLKTYYNHPVYTLSLKNLKDIGERIKLVK